MPKGRANGAGSAVQPAEIESGSGKARGKGKPGTISDGVTVTLPVGETVSAPVPVALAALAAVDVAADVAGAKPQRQRKMKAEPVAPPEAVLVAEQGSASAVPPASVRVAVKGAAPKKGKGRQRANGEGNIRQRADGRWEGRISLPDGRRKSLFGKTRQEVARLLAAALRDRDKGLPIVGEKQTVKEFLQQWLETAVKDSVRPGTYAAYALNTRRVQPHVGGVKLARLTPQQLQACYGALLEGGLSRRSVEQCHTVLHRAFRQAVQWGLLGVNPTDAASPPRPKRREMQTLDADQVGRLFDTTREDRYHALWVLLITTGVRLGEATGLKWEDLDTGTGRLTIRRALQRQKGVGLVFVEPKSDRSRRTVHLAPSAVEVLSDHRLRQLKERHQAGDAYQNGGLVFCRADGRPLEPGWVNVLLHRALAAADLPQIRVHDLRHSAATLLLQKGVHPKVVQELLGHSTIVLTLDTYSHVPPALHQEAANQMESLFRHP